MIRKSKPTIMDTKPSECFLCGRWCRTHKHHIYGGANRKLSEREGLYVYLCPACHNMSRDGVHMNAEKNRALQVAGQRRYEETHSRQDFMQIFGRNYIEEEE